MASRTIMNMKKRKSRFAAALAAALLAGALMTQTGVAAPLDDVWDSCSVTVQFPEEKEDGSFAELKDTAVQLDIYQVAKGVRPDSVPDESGMAYDAYSFEWNDAYAAAHADWEAAQPEDPAGQVSAEAVESLTQGLAAAALASEDTAKALLSDTGTVGQEKMIDAGLYLLIAHGIEDSLDTYKDVTDNKISTIVKSGSKQYRFAPMLISVPQRGNLEDHVIGNGTITAGDETILEYPLYGSKTSDEDDWNGRLFLIAKVAEEDVNGYLRIQKTIDSYDSMDERFEPGTFVFRVRATETQAPDSKVLYSNVASVVLSAAGTSDGETLEGIPVGSYAWVDEVYAGPNYTLASSQGPIQIAADDPDTEEIEMVTVSFSNSYNETGWNGGGSVRNHFAADEDGWDANGSTKTYADSQNNRTTETLFPSTQES